MPDRTLCTNDRCPLRDECGRYAGNWHELSERQSYAEFAPDVDAFGGVTGCEGLKERDDSNA